MRQLQNDLEKIGSFYQNHRSNIPPDSAFTYGLINMRLVGLFDRPATRQCLFALRRPPVITGLTDTIANIDDKAWQRAIARLREIRLLNPADSLDSNTLDAHPLVREWFAAQLQQINADAWHAGHGRLYEHLRDKTKEGNRPTLENLAPLYQAIGHGCRAQRHQEALDHIYISRICRRRSRREARGYSLEKLGAHGSDLAALSSFFSNGYDSPVATLKGNRASFVRGMSAICLSALGRYSEALLLYYKDYDWCIADQDTENASIMACHISEAELCLGNVSVACRIAAQGTDIAYRCGDLSEMCYCRAIEAHAVHVRGDHELAEKLFADAELMQREIYPKYTQLCSLQDYYYCELLLDKQQWATVRDRATNDLNRLRKERHLLTIGLDQIMVVRAKHGLALSTRDLFVVDGKNKPLLSEEQFRQGIEKLREANNNRFLCRAILARAAFRRSVGDWRGAAQDLDDVEEIAELGPMRLILCDIALERARLAFAQIKAFAPLNGLLEKDNPPKPSPPSPDGIAPLKNEAGGQLTTAADYIATCGYHKRDAELAELEAVLAGSRRFAGLPPRV